MEILTKYLKAVEDFDTCEEWINNISWICLQAHQGTMRRKRDGLIKLYFEDTEAVPVKTVMDAHAKPISAALWPTANQWQEKINEWHMRKEERDKLWGMLPENLKSQMKDPNLQKS